MLLRPFRFFALLALSSAAAAAPEVRAPRGGWTVDFADAQCLASRDYGSRHYPMKLVLKAPAIGEVMQVAVLRTDSARAAVQLEGSVAIDDRPRFRTSMLAFSPKNSGLRVYTMNMPAADFALVRTARQLSIRAGELDERFSLSQMTELLKIVDDCVADLRRIFNITDPQAGAASPLQRRATGNIGRLLKSEDYPAPALSQEQTGRVKFVLLIDETGRVADCTVIETSGVASLDSQACATLKTRARLEPAVGPDGKPAKDAVTSRIIWKIDH